MCYKHWLSTWKKNKPKLLLHNIQENLLEMDNKLKRWGKTIKNNKKTREKIFVTLGQANISWMEHNKHKPLKKNEYIWFDRSPHLPELLCNKSLTSHVLIVPFVVAQNRDSSKNINYKTIRSPKNFFNSNSIIFNIIYYSVFIFPWLSYTLKKFVYLNWHIYKVHIL